MSTTIETSPASTAIEKAKAAARALNEALREAARENVTLSVALHSEPMHHDRPGPEVTVVDVTHQAHRGGRRPEDLNSANDD